MPPDKEETRGRPPFQPTPDDRKTVELMCAVGIAQEGIALCIQDGISVETMQKYFDAELKTAAIKANTKVGGSMFQQAINGNVNAQKWWTACRMGWKDQTDINTNATIVIEHKDAGLL